MKKNQKHTFEKGQGGTAIAVRIIPASGRNEIVGILPDGRIMVNLLFSNDSENSELIAFLASLFHIPNGNIEIVAGQDKRDKLIGLIGINPDVVQKLMKTV